MKRFKIGDKVVALTNPVSELSQPRVKGKLYIVHDVIYCPKCGEQLINIGFYAGGVFVICVKCDNEQFNNGLHWTSSEYFAYPEELQAELEQAVAKEEYEFAAELRDLINNK